MRVFSLDNKTQRLKSEFFSLFIRLKVRFFFSLFYQVEMLKPGGRFQSCFSTLTPPPPPRTSPRCKAWCVCVCDQSSNKIQRSYLVYIRYNNLILIPTPIFLSWRCYITNNLINTNTHFFIMAVLHMNYGGVIDELLMV